LRKSPLPLQRSLLLKGIKLVSCARVFTRALSKEELVGLFQLKDEHFAGLFFGVKMVRASNRRVLHHVLDNLKKASLTGSCTLLFKPVEGLNSKEPPLGPIEKFMRMKYLIPEELKSHSCHVLCFRCMRAGLCTFGKLRPGALELCKRIAENVEPLMSVLSVVAPISVGVRPGQVPGQVQGQQAPLIGGKISSLMNKRAFKEGLLVPANVIEFDRLINVLKHLGVKADREILI